MTASVAIKLLLVAAFVALLSGCALNGLVGGTTTYCDIAQPITWSQADTDDTIKQVKSHNAVHKEICG